MTILYKFNQAMSDFVHDHTHNRKNSTYFIQSMNYTTDIMLK